MAKSKSLWLRLYTEILNDPKVQRLPDSLFRAYINFLCIAKEYSDDGVLPPKKDIAFFLRCPENSVKKFCDGLKKAELLDADGDALIVHGWNNRQYESDNDHTANMRKRRQRERDKTQDVTRDVTDMSRVTSRTSHEKVTRTETETETETETDKYNTQDACEEPPPSSVTVFKPKIETELFTAIEQTFLSVSGKFTDPPAEINAIRTIMRYVDNNPGDAEAMLATFLNLTRGDDDFWKRQPFTPTRLARPKIWDSVKAEVRKHTGSQRESLEDMERRILAKRAAKVAGI